MINVKLLVLFVCINNIRESYSDYCRICPRHTMCMYKNPGPGPYCSLYDNTALMTKEDVETIVNKINQRRNFVALGLARNLPSAANMNKMRWSEELAVFAQRWADQCDPSIRPDKKDLCRDLVDTKVGQNIATVMGLSPGLNVKSFVEMWYMQALEYSGSVTYYNQTHDRKTDYFTQLIWAETTLVGCGKARFSIDDKGTMIDRFVCNFAAKGNVRGKPVYTIGFPATQCKEGSEKDDIFTGLCRPLQEKSHVTIPPTESSLLRIINLPNIPMKTDIDPLRLDHKSREMSQDVLNFMRHQNLRHIPNNTRQIIHHVTPRMQNLQESPNIPSRHDVIPRQHPFGYSLNIHDPYYRTRTPLEQYRRNDYMRETLIPSYYDLNVRRRTFNGQCTRNLGAAQNKNTCQDASHIEPNSQCTRTGKKRNEYILTTEPRCRITERFEPKKTCQYTCNSQKPTCILNPTTISDNCNLNCHCPNIINPRPENHRRIPGEYVYYDYPNPNLALRSGEGFEEKEHVKQPSKSIQASLSQYQNDVNSNSDYFTHAIKTFGLSGNRQKYHRNYRDRNHPHLVSPGDRVRRQIENHDMDFWKIDKSDKRSQKRTPRYTTLRSNIHRKFRTTFRNIEFNTEPITITAEALNKHRHDSTDRSLSFDELMYFRKNRGGEIDLNMRRKNAKATTKKKITTTKKSIKKLAGKAAPTTTTTKATTTTTTKATTKESPPPATHSTTLLTIIGSFSPQSLCTRRVTCTWTQPIITDANGNVITNSGGGGNGGGGNGGGGDGGRTPWGHVPNCTRRYTCSRIYYDRNVQASDTAAGDSTEPDEDYCERRALNVKRRVSYGSDTIQTSNDHKDLSDFSEVTPSMKYINSSEQTDCSCTNQELRDKRSVTCKHKERLVQERKVNKKEPTKNLYLLAFSKFIQLWEKNRSKSRDKPGGCHCNASVATYNMHNCQLFILFIVLCLLN